MTEMDKRVGGAFAEYPFFRGGLVSVSACVFISAGGAVYFCFILGVFSGSKGMGLQVVCGE
jgi:hypothetical protein